MKLEKEQLANIEDNLSNNFFIEVDLLWLLFLMTLCFWKKILEYFATQPQMMLLRFT